MKKLFLICLLVILPLQFSYAAVSCHCSNEQPVSSQKNQISYSDIDGKHEPANNGTHSCGCLGHCHVFGAVTFHSYTSPLALAEDSLLLINDDEFYQSYISNGLERPNWKLAA